MFFKKVQFLVFALSVAGCSRMIGEPPPLQKELVIDFKDSQTQKESENPCSIDVYLLTKAFETGALTTSSIQQTVSCVEEALITAQKKLETIEEGVLSYDELQKVIDAKVLGDPVEIKKWVWRLFSARDIILGENVKKISFFQISKILKKIKNGAREIESLSQSFSRYQKLSSEKKEYWGTRKKLIEAYLNLAKKLIINEQGKYERSYTKDFLLKQYRVWDSLHEEVGEHYVKAGFLANRVFFGKTEGLIEAFDFEKLLQYFIEVYMLVTDVEELLANKVWTIKESISFINAYKNLLEKLLHIFLAEGQKELKKEDLIRMLEFLHEPVEGKGGELVEAILELKVKIFGGSLESFTNEELEKISKSFKYGVDSYNRSERIFEKRKDYLSLEEIKQWIEEKGSILADANDYFKILESLPKILYFWTTPYQSSFIIRKSNFTLSQVTSVLFRNIVDAYDDDQDGKLSLKLYDVRPEVPPEIGHMELIGLVNTTQKFFKGLDFLAGKKDDMWSKPLGLDPQILGQVLIVLADQLLYNSNADNTIDTFELTEVASFIFENMRAVTWFYWDPKIRPFHLPGTENEQKLLKREGLLSLLDEVETLRWYFPNIIQDLSQKEIVQYVENFIAMIGRNNPENISSSELGIIFGVVRLVETIFLKYDQNKDGFLDYKEVNKIYSHFEPTIKSIIQNHEKYDKDFENIPVIGAVGQFSTYILKKFRKNIISMDSIYKKIFQYSVTNAKLPKSWGDLFVVKIKGPDDMDSISYFSENRVKTDRMTISKLLADIAKTAQEINWDE
ncbi:MAG: hypothetical protein HYW47_00320 [Deltaproteobacteria bacterium]|nr:hypothetical protein [Deltaproteobacteria bacterium]